MIETNVDGPDRLELTDGVEEVCVKMSGGNPGALRVLMELMENFDFMTFVGICLRMDGLRIREHRIWLAYKDICKQDIQEFKRRMEKEMGLVSTELKAIPGY